MIQTQQYQTDASEYAEVTSVQHPLVKAQGFSNINPGEMVVFEDQSLGQILSFSANEIKLMVFSKTPVRVGLKLYRTKKQLSFPISPNIFGSVFSPMGDLLMTSRKKLSTAALIYNEIYQEPASITQRRRVNRQLITGFSITDLLLPLGEGQRELLIGDRKSGKSAFAKNLAVKQALLGNKVVYAMVAKKTSDIREAHEFFIKQGVVDSVVIVATTPKDSISAIVITPFSAMTIAEYVVSQGENVLLVIDDLTSQAEFYREISLLAKKFPGRDSYPGDIFFTQAQLLERAGTYAHPTDPKKVISLTCLPVVRTVNSDLTDFVASNLISITDGHLLFEPRLFNQGFRPAINTSLSVTRVGKQTQSPLQRDINLRITSFLTSYQKTRNLTHLGSEISEQSQKILQKGEFLTDFFSQSNGIPLNIQIILLAMIWLDWFERSHKNVITTCKFELNKNYGKKDVQVTLDQIIENSKSLKDLLATVEKNKPFLLGLCQV
ncbi:MAG: hypothetical protein BroJett025_00120 [Patescibacteria group bacterium]|nr:MAG: hypothetical protein BroJett025_00120 [Patescibacteria group bacterium]